MNIGIYKLSTGYYQTSYVHPDSKRRIRNKFESYNGAQAYIDKLRKHLDYATNDTLESLMESYIQNNPTKNIKKRYTYLFNSFMKEFGSMRIQDINKFQIENWFDNIEKTYAHRTLLQFKYILTPFFNTLIDKKIINHNPAAQVVIKHGKRVKEKVFLSEVEIKSILNKLKESSPEQLYPVIYFLVHTGCRLKDALTLKWQQIDELTVQFNSTPQSAARKINLSPMLIDYLKTKQRESEFVFLNSKKRPWAQHYFTAQLTKARAQINLNRHWDSFSFRTSFAYHFLRKSGTIQQLQVVLGHRCIKDTLSAYGSIITSEDTMLSPYEYRQL